MRTSHRNIPVELIPIRVQLDKIQSLRCLSCRRMMDLHQPDAGFPERMLWTCNHCGTWYLMDLAPDKPEAVLVSLPDEGYFRKRVGL